MRAIAGNLRQLTPAGCYPSAATDLPSLDAVVEPFVEPNEGLVVRVVVIDDVSGRERVIPLAHKIGLRVLERGGHFQFIPDAQEQGTSIAGQAADQMCAE